MGIKKEKTDAVRNPVPTIRMPNSKPIIQTSNQEKRKLIDKIGILQTENQRILLELKSKESECVAQASKEENMHRALVDQVHALSNENKLLQSQLLSTKTELSAAKQTISNLNLEKRKMNAVINQLKTRSVPPMVIDDPDDSKNDDGFYEVEKLLKHCACDKDGIQYLVRWKNFSEKDDTWQKESDLNCPRILNEYKRKMKLN